MSLFGDLSEDGLEPKRGPRAPLAERMRPASLDEYLGQDALLGEGRALRAAIEQGVAGSLLLFGPPGVGKTTLGLLIAKHADLHFQPFSAVLSGVAQVREAVAEAKQRQQRDGRGTLLFVDEIHRFNKAQQDAFLPFVEDGTLTFIGATTENPSFQLNHALLSRLRVYVLQPLDTTTLINMMQQALQDANRGLLNYQLVISDKQLQQLAHYADGDGRRCLNLLEVLCDTITPNTSQCRVVDDATLNQLLASNIRAFDARGDIFYDQLSALHKSLRGSDPDAAAYWLQRLLDGGCDPAVIARRLTRVASEDIGNADPRALSIALDAWQAYERLGSPEGELALSQAAIYLACAAKSDAVSQATKTIRQVIESSGNLPVPLHCRNAPTAFARSQGHGKGYRSAHQHPNGYIADMHYLPDSLTEQRYYHPVERGLEIQIRKKLDQLNALRQSHRRNSLKNTEEN